MVALVQVRAALLWCIVLVLSCVGMSMEPTSSDNSKQESEVIDLTCIDQDSNPNSNVQDNDVLL